MYAEVVLPDGVPSKSGLIHDRSRAITCAECGTSYDLYYDREAETRSTLCSILAAEIISAQHPVHQQIVVLDLSEQVAER